MKFCPRCQDTLDEDMFYHRPSGQSDHYCQPCRSSYTKDRKAKKSLLGAPCKLSAMVGEHTRQKIMKQLRIKHYGEATVEFLDAHKEDWEECMFAASLESTSS